MSKFSVKDKIDEQIYRFFNIASDIFFKFNFSLRKVLKKNFIFHKKHHENRCFIMATGPSLNDLSLDQISGLGNEIIFGVNSFYKASVVDSLTPTYYALLDNNYWGVAGYTFSDVLKKYKKNPPVFITDVRAAESISALREAEYISLYTKNYPCKEIRFDICNNMSITMNVVSTSILVAIYMGFKEIYLLGCDYNLFCSRQGTHCYDDRDEIDELPKYNLSFYLKYYHLTTEFHYLIASLAKKNNVKIINLTKNSLLDAYPMSDLNFVL